VKSDRYAPFYCEENVWWLAEAAVRAGRDAEVVLVSNARRTVLVWSQRAASSAEKPVSWDYHVVLAVEGEHGLDVIDPDCTRGPVLPATSWLDVSFDARVPIALAPRFRSIGAAAYVAGFSSDRRHMRTPEGGFHAPPPPWPIIGGGAHALDRFLAFDDESLPPWIELPALRARWARLTQTNV
jgi:hypothetical protein